MIVLSICFFEEYYMHANSSELEITDYIMRI